MSVFVLSGTAAVALAGVIAAMRITKTKLSEHKYLFQGAGEVCLSLCIYIYMCVCLCDWSCSWLVGH